MSNEVRHYESLSVNLFGLNTEESETRKKVWRDYFYDYHHNITVVSIEETTQWDEEKGAYYYKFKCSYKENETPIP